MNPAIIGNCLRSQAAAILVMADEIDCAACERAVDLILGCRGRVVVSGVGKSGHIARKIAATLSATGTPAVFLHAAEAAHGDVGNIALGDVVICLSKSGESQELFPVIQHAHSTDVPIIGITARPDSTLGRESQVAIPIPDLPEVSPFGVPTISAGLMLAAGDAVAMAVMEAKGVGASDLAKLHPGGALGERLRAVAC